MPRLSLLSAITISQRGLWHCNEKLRAQYISSNNIGSRWWGQVVYLTTKLRSVEQRGPDGVDYKPRGRRMPCQSGVKSEDDTAGDQE